MSQTSSSYRGEVVSGLEPARTAPQPLLDAGRAQLLVVDVQTGLADAMPPGARRRALAALDLLARAADALGVPATITEHRPDGLGATLPSVRDALRDATVLAKTRFCAASDAAIVERLDGLGRPDVVVAGMETHVCVLQAALVLAASGRRVHLAFDASAARDPMDEELARARAIQAGVVPVSADMVAFEWLRRGDHPARRTIIEAVKAKAAATAGHAP